MSVYSDCSQAITDLASKPEVFTEIDIVNQAASDGWNKTMFKEARKYANQIVSAKYRNGELVRYGPVEYDGVKDYARRAAVIVYGGTENGPVTWDTPNGSFPRISRHEDDIQSSGRRKGTARHDERSWSEQDLPSNIKAPAARKASSRSGRSDSRTEINRLKTALVKASERITELEGELAAVRAGQVTAPTATNGTADLHGLVEAIVLELMSDWDSRLISVEERVNRFTSALAG